MYTTAHPFPFLGFVELTYPYLSPQASRQSAPLPMGVWGGKGKGGGEGH